MKRGNKSLGLSLCMSLIVFGIISSSNLWAGNEKNLLPLPVELMEPIFSYLSLGQLVEIYSSDKINDSDKFEIGRILPKTALGSSLGELIEIHSSNKINDVAINAEIRRIILKKDLGAFILLPEVTPHDIHELGQAGVDTSIIRPMPAFRVAQTKTPVGLYYAVHGRFPDLAQVNLSNQDKAEIIAKWKSNPELPLTFTTSAEDVALADRLSEMTGRRFRVTSNPENEYSIRGRAEVSGKPTGSITTSTYYFGNDAAQVSKHGWFYSNSGGSTHGVNEHPPGYETVSKHSFGLTQPIGNVWVRSSDGVLRGGCFDPGEEWHARSSLSYEGRADRRRYDLGFRLVEEV